MMNGEGQGFGMVLCDHTSDCLFTTTRFNSFRADPIVTKAMAKDPTTGYRYCNLGDGLTECL